MDDAVYFNQFGVTSLLLLSGPVWEPVKVVGIMGAEGAAAPLDECKRVYA